MNFQDLNQHIKISFPPYVNNKASGNIRSITKDYLDEFSCLISNITDVNFDYYTKSHILKFLQIQRDAIIKAIDHYLAGEIIEYYTEIYSAYFDGSFMQKQIFFKTIGPKSPFFRVRINQPNKTYKNHEMFHIPFEQIHRTGNQRFSLSGHPALYLGTSAFVCWEELSKPPLEHCNFSVFINQRVINVFDLTPPIIKKADDILRFPLIIASSIRLNNKGFNFKPEYIIPQALYFGLIKFNRTDLKKEAQPIDKLDAILYLSTHISHELLFDDPNLMCNFVFPVEQICEKGYCENLKQLFIVSEGKSFNDLWLKFPRLFVNNETYTEEYEQSIFKTIEKYISGKTVKKSFIE